MGNRCVERKRIPLFPTLAELPMPRVSDEAVIVGVNFQAIVGTPVAVISRIHRLVLPPGKLGKWAAIITVAVISRIHRLAFPPRELGRYGMIMVRIDELKNFCN